MNQINQNLNLARKWRPKTFDQIVGQEISVRMLKNGLYLKKLFPVYLFAGQRGCGKTSAARVFAAAINCENLEKFQEKPSEFPVPCLKCDSCKSMLKMNHPDFIEIDAASHTGVENVRQILESCSYKPIFGRKKIYLIDEAHMLSKAAFNAFLKILEEPPASALFILATTETPKIPDTVLSRCFQAIFKPINNESLKKHLNNICQKEEIHINQEALNILVQETQGSCRDAINLLEQVRFSEDEITTDSILKILGKVSENELFTLFESAIEKKPEQLLTILSSKIFQNINPQILWNMIIQLCRSLVWIKFKAPKLPTYFNNKEHLTKLANKCSLNRLNAILQLLWTQEDIFLKTPQKQIFLETVLLQICQQVNIADLEEILKEYKATPQNIQSTNTQSTNIQSTDIQPTTIQPPTTIQKASPPSNALNQPLNNQANPPRQQTNNYQTPPQLNNNSNASNTSPVINTSSQKAILNDWNTFLSKISDQFLISILKQAQFIGKDEEKKLIKISLSNDSIFFKDKINESKKDWEPALNESFPNYFGFDFIKKKTSPQNSIQTEKKTGSNINSPQGNTQGKPSTPTFQQTPSLRSFNVDISDKSKWPKANLITKYFPGRLKRGKITTKNSS